MCLLQEEKQNFKFLLVTFKLILLLLLLVVVVVATFCLN